MECGLRIGRLGSNEQFSIIGIFPLNWAGMMTQNAEYEANAMLRYDANRPKENVAVSLCLRLYVHLLQVIGNL
jgi:hypothetical protein